MDHLEDELSSTTEEGGGKGYKGDEPEDPEGKESRNFDSSLNFSVNSSTNSSNDEKDDEEEGNLIPSSSNLAMVKHLL